MTILRELHKYGCSVSPGLGILSEPTAKKGGLAWARISYPEAPITLYAISLNSKILDFKFNGTIRYISI